MVLPPYFKNPEEPLGTSEPLAFLFPFNYRSICLDITNRAALLASKAQASNAENKVLNHPKPTVIMPIIIRFLLK